MSLMSKLRRVQFVQRHNEAIIAGYRVVPVLLVRKEGARPQTCYKAFAPSGARLNFWGNLVLDNERAAWAACSRHMGTVRNTSAPVWEEPHLPNNGALI